MSEVLQPGVQIKPEISQEGAQKLVERLYGISVVSMKEMEAYDDKNYHIQIAGAHDNPYLTTWTEGYVFKILNSMDSQKISYVQAQNEMMIHLGERGIRCTQPVKNLNGNNYSLEPIPSEGSTKYAVRLLTFQPGEILYSVPLTAELCVETGNYLARLNTALEDFKNSAYDNHKSIWALDSAVQLPKFLFALKEPEHVALVNNILSEFERLVIPVKNDLAQGMIHGDFNEHNILVQRDDEGVWHVDGVLDFGDTQRSCYLFEVALAACYNMLLAKPPLSPMQALVLTVVGYYKLRPLSGQELHLLQVCICARVCQSLVLGAYSHLQDPGNEYVLQTAKSGNAWKLLADVWTEPAERFLQTLQNALQK